MARKKSASKLNDTGVTVARVGYAFKHDLSVVPKDTAEQEIRVNVIYLPDRARNDWMDE